jgi:hypothetical protein
MPLHWLDFYQEIVLNELLVKGNKPGHAITNIGRQVRILAACAGEVEPWYITSEVVQRAYNVALLIGDSGKIAADMAMVIRTVIDGLHLANHSPLAPFCIPYPSEVLGRDSAQEAIV